MKFLIIITLALSTLAAQAQSKDACLKEAQSVVSGLEVLWADLFGPIQGDLMDEELSATVKKTTKENITYAISATHTNEDGEAWYNEYLVTMNKNWCSLETYEFLGSEAAQPECVDLETAKKEASRVLDFYLDTIPSDLFSWLDEDSEYDYLTSSMYDHALFSLVWDEKENRYWSDVIFEKQCQAGAECWGGITVSCEGEFGIWEGGD